MPKRILIVGPKCTANNKVILFKVHIFWESHKILQNLPLTFDHSTLVKSKGKILQNFVAFSEYMNFT